VKAEGRSQKAEGGRTEENRTVLVCFAVKEEARAIQPWLKTRRDFRMVIVGMGKRNAERATRAALSHEKPALVITCGFAGGLRQGLETGTVVFAANDATGLEAKLIATGAKPARFACVERVAATAAEKRALRDATGADAVEMESGVISAVCGEDHIPCATVRVILDTAEEDLPLDFNALMTPDQQMSYAKLALALAKSPGKIAGLLKLQKQSNAAAERLGQVLRAVLE
jgi:adenosylhomocysteine nucleosidase